MVWFKIALAVIWAVAWGVHVYMCDAKERGRKPVKGRLYLQSPHPLGTVLLFVLTFCLSFWYGKQVTAKFLQILTPMLLCFAVYYTLLVALIPALRRFISARACSCLWGVPNSVILLYITTRKSNYMTKSLVIRLPISISEATGKVLLSIWLAGFVAILAWSILSHLIFRRQLLKDARLVPLDSPVRAVWYRQLDLGHFEAVPFRLMTSPRVKTPLSIGLFDKTTCVVLPEKDYTPEELALLLRHELVHIARWDSCNKLTMTLCTAMFWFNPFMWIAMRQSADDMELSCDETVLLGYQEQTRRDYANLLLQTAADQRGFTTCLSASASALRYRLKNVIAPRKQFVGGVVVGIIVCIFALTCIFADISFEQGTLAENFFQKQELQQVHSLVITLVVDDEISHYKAYDQENQQAIISYLSGLQTSSITGIYDPWEMNPYTQIDIESATGRCRMIVTEEYLGAQRAGENTVYYHLDTPIDWDYLIPLIQSGTPDW